MQLFAVDQQRSQALEAHAASFASFRVRLSSLRSIYIDCNRVAGRLNFVLYCNMQVPGNDKDSILICFASKTINAGQVTSKMHVIELGAQPGINRPRLSITNKIASIFLLAWYKNKIKYYFNINLPK